MKYIVFLIIITILAAGCNTKVNMENEKLKLESDSLKQLSIKKDSALNYFIKSIDDIQSNLDIIKEKESLITISKNNIIEKNSQEAKDHINNDIQIIYELLLKNKETVSNLRNNFDKANLRIAEFEKVIKRLTQQIEEKDAEIVHLNETLISMNIQIENLNNIASNLTAESKIKTEIIEKKDTQLNTAYYVFGNEKELKENQIITKEGGFIGLGKTKKLKNDFNKEYFTKINIRETKSISLFCKKAKLITSHPNNSYKFYGENTVDSLVIIDENNFWEATKYLVLVID